MSFVLIAIGVFSIGDAKAVQAVVTHNIFYMPAEGKPLALKPYVEMYWEIAPASIVFEKVNDSLKGRIRTDIIITSEKGKVNQDHYIFATTPAEDGKAALALKLIDLKRFELEEGQYTIELNLQDYNNQADKFTYKDSFTVKTPAMPAFSDIQLVDTAVASEKESVFQRNDKLQIPLSTNFIDDRRKTLYYYAELYNTHNLSAGEPVIVKAYISKKELGTAQNGLMNIDTLPSALLSIAEGGLSVASLSSGNYNLNLVAETKNRERLAAKSIFFQLINTKPVAFEEKDTSSGIGQKEQFINLSKTFLGKYTPPQIKAILKMLVPIAEAGERTSINAFLKQPDDVYSRYFIYNFWLSRDKLNPEKRWKEYVEKVREVNRLFGSSLLAGYETDRGRIYLKYGKPSSRIVVENESGALPYEVWQYASVSQLGDALFLFYRQGLMANDYKLLHSTVASEVRNRAWRNYLYSTNSNASDGVRNSRAEQYFENR